MKLVADSIKEFSKSEMERRAVADASDFALSPDVAARDSEDL